jgi:hypothetical protein
MRRKSRKRRKPYKDGGIGGELMNQARAYFLITGDRESKVWIFRDDVRSRFLPNTFSCGTDNFRIQIVDPFGGRHPLLMCHEALSEKTVIPFLPTVILDSNIVSYLCQTVFSKQRIVHLSTATIALLQQKTDHCEKSVKQEIDMLIICDGSLAHFGVPYHEAVADSCQHSCLVL